MGLLVSLLGLGSTNMVHPPDASPHSSPRHNPPPPSPPSYISLPPPPIFSSFTLLSSDEDTPSPYLTFHTAPSSPYTDQPPPPSPSLFFTPPSSPQSEHAPPVPPMSIDAHPPPAPIAVPHIPDPTLNNIVAEDTFPSTTIDLAVDLALDDEGLSTLEKIYLFSRSKASFHRIFIAHALPSYLEQITPQEATEYVLPLLSGLAMDEDEQVKEALAAELVPIIWWFFSHCQIIPDELGAEEAVYASSSTTVAISVQAFTPILGTLLLSSNPLVGGTARYAVVNILSRMKKANDIEAGRPPSRNVDDQFAISQTAVHFPLDDDDDENENFTGLFKRDERAMFQQEILQQVVIGMGRLDVDVDMEGDQYEGAYTADSEHEQWNQSREGAEIEVVTPEQDQGEEGAISSPRELQREKMESGKNSESINPYFPVLPSTFANSSPASSTASTPPSTTSTPSSYSSSGSSAAASLSNQASPAREFPPLSSTRLLRMPLSPSELRFSSESRDSQVASSSETKALSSPAIFDNQHLNITSFPSAQFNATLPATEMAHPKDAAVISNQTSTDITHHQQTTPISPIEVYPRPTYSARTDHGQDGYENEETVEDEQAAVGRLSSMSLMAAVTASGSLGEDTKVAFVKEVERVGRDPVYWVRREASFALGALAKVVPDELVTCSLLPLFDSLRWDSVWHVRHSVLFALPAILSRLSPQERRSIALDTILGLSSDDSATVRSGVLEALGEVLYTFHKDPGGPPEELVHLFLGRREDRRVRDGQQEEQHNPTPNSNDRLESLYRDPERPLICAFNFPAIALTLGRDRWGELREAYLDIAANRSFKVRRTLAASLGELAKIIGQENAQKDLTGVWWDSIRCEDEEVRLKAVESMETFMSFLSQDVATDIIQGLLQVWDEKVFRSWRERELIVKVLPALAKSIGHDIADVVRSLLMRALEDNVAAVRETATSTVPAVWSMLSSRSDVRTALQADLTILAHSPVYRKRMTFIACLQALVLAAEDDDQLSVVANDNMLVAVSDLVEDSIEGVRISIARFTGVLCGRFLGESPSIPDRLVGLAGRLSQDKSQEVRSYIPDLSQSGLEEAARLRRWEELRKHTTRLSTFSRPPLPLINTSDDALPSWPPKNVRTSRTELEQNTEANHPEVGNVDDVHHSEQLLAGRESLKNDVATSPGEHSAGELRALEAMSLHGDEDVEMFAPDFVMHGGEGEVPCTV